MLIKIPLLVELLGVSRPTAYSILEYIKQHPEGLEALEIELENFLFKKYVDYKKSIHKNHPKDLNNIVDGEADIAQTKTK